MYHSTPVPTAEAFTSPRQQGNVYTSSGAAAAWEQQEGNRLRSMREYVGAVCRADLGPVFDEVQGRHPGQQLEMVDLGAGPDRGVEDFATERGVGYTAYDGNQTYLAQRVEEGTDPSSVIVGRLEDMGDIPEAAFDISYSRAATGWSAARDHTIAEQLRITGDTAVFSEFNWRDASVESNEMEVESAAYLAKMAMIRILQAAGFNPLLGESLQERVATVAAAQGYVIEQHHQPRPLPPGDHREIFVESIHTILGQVQAVTNNPDSSTTAVVNARLASGPLLEALRVFERYPQAQMTVRLPELVTEVVRIIKRPDAA